MLEDLNGLRHFENDQKLRFRFGLLEDSWRRAYPDVDIKKELAWAEAWLTSNPKKVKKDNCRFLGNWMKSAQERARSVFKVNPLPPVKHEEIPESEIVTGEMFAELRMKLKKIKT